MTTSTLNLSATQSQTIDIQHLLQMVNAARKECGEVAVRNNKFIEKIADELDGETYTKSVGRKNGQDIEVVIMTIKQALWVASRESKAVRRSLVDKLEAVHNPPPIHRDLSTMEILQIALESEKGRLAEKERADHAERTKSQISRKREASALGKLGAATRKCNQLSERLGESVKHATITAIENATDSEYRFSLLRKWCRENNLTATDVPDPRYGSVKSWPAEAWLAVYGVDLKKLFGGN